MQFMQFVQSPEILDDILNRLGWEVGVVSKQIGMVDHLGDC